MSATRRRMHEGIIWGKKALSAQAGRLWCGAQS